MAGKSAPDQYVVRFALGFDYIAPDQKTPVRVDRGQVITLVGAKNDEKLIRLGYLVPMVGSPRLAECGVCGGRYIDDQSRDEHGKVQHKRRSWETEDFDQNGHGVVDRIGDGDDAKVAAMSPLYMDKTAASLKG